MVLGLTRANISHNALGIGMAIGCIVGGIVAPRIVAPEQAEFIGSAAATRLNSTLDIDGTMLPSFYSHASLSLYLTSFRSFPSLPRLDQWSLLIATFLILLFVRLLIQWFLRPFEYVRGYKPEKRLEAAYLRLAGEIPPGYPNTWYKVCDEFDVPSSLPSSKSDGTGFYRTDVLGETLLIFRSPQEITFQGQVESTKMGEIIILNESSLEGDLSLLTKLNFSRLTSLKGLMKYRSIEINRMIFLWHHEHNFVSDSYDPTKVLVEPEWDIPIIPGMEDFVYHGRVQHEIACHIQEIPENGADVAHLDYIHGDFLLSWLRILRHTWSARWDPQHEPTGHIAKLILNQKVSIFGLSIPGTSLDSNIDQVGPGLVQLIFPTPFGRVAVIETITPICHTLQRANNVLYAEKTVPRFMAKVFLMGLVVQFERDLPIWNYKHFLRKPLILKEDGPILRYRRWMRQFYSNQEYQKELKEQSEQLMTLANE